MHTGFVFGCVSVVYRASFLVTGGRKFCSYLDYFGTSAFAIVRGQM